MDFSLQKSGLLISLDDAVAPNSADSLFFFFFNLELAAGISFDFPSFYTHILSK